MILMSVFLDVRSEDDFGLKKANEVVINEKTKKNTERPQDFFYKNLSGSIGHASIMGTADDYRGYSHARIRFDRTIFSRTKLVMEGLYEYTHIKFTQLAENSNLIGTPDYERKLNYKKGKLKGEEVYIKKDLFDNLTLSYGIQKIVWGQFEPYSPTNMVFPFNLSTTDVEFNKVKGTLSQEAAVINFYPKDYISLSLYAFPKLTYDTVIQRRLERAQQSTGPNSTNVSIPKAGDQWQKAARLMFYSSWGTFGISYHDGYNTSRPFRDERIVGAGFPYTNQRTLTFTERKMIGFEMAIPSGSWTYKLEFARSNEFEEINFDGTLNNIALLNTEQQNYLMAIIGTNERKLYVPFKSNILSVGTTANLNRWYVNLVLFYLNNSYSSEAQRLKDLEERAFPSRGTSSGYDGPIFPGLVLSRYLNDEKNSELGLALGIISNGQGAALYYKKVTNSIVYGAALQSIEYFSDDNVAETGSDEGYKKKEGSNTGVLLSMTYKF